MSAPTPDLHSPLVIIGGGLAGSLAALMLAEQRPDIPILLLEAGETFGGNHTWSFFDTDIPQEAASLVRALSPVRWPRHKVRFPARQRELAMAYNAVSAPALDALVRARLPDDSWRSNAKVQQFSSNAVTLTTGETITARGVIDARGPDGPMPGLQLGWQKFVGIEFASAALEPNCAMVMDATMAQIDGYRFVYVLPLTPDRVLVEDTYYSDGPDLDVTIVADRVRDLAAGRGISGPEMRQETGILPIIIGGDADLFWPKDDPIPRLGLRGGFFHPTTGYSFSFALRLAVALATQVAAYDTPALAQWTRTQFQRHWKATGYYRLLNRLLFRAAAPEERYRIFQHFYRLPPDVIARFYAGQTSMRDRIRIFSGKPPVSVGAALNILVSGNKAG